LLVLPTQAASGTPATSDTHEATDVETGLQALQAAALVRGLPLNVVRLTEPGLRALYDAPLTLIRPDHIVSWRGHTVTDAQAVIDQVLGWRLCA
jgi:hypothetical protein